MSAQAGWSPVAAGGRGRGSGRRRPSEWLIDLRRTVAVRLLILRLLSGAGAGLLAPLAVVIPLQVGLPVVFVVLTGHLVAGVSSAAGQGLHSPEARRLVIVVALLGTVFVVERLLLPAGQAIRFQLARRIDGQVRHRLLTAALAGTDATRLSQQAFRDQLARAGQFRSDEYTPGKAAAALTILAANYLQVLGAVVIVGTISVPLAVLLGATVLVVRHRYRTRVLGLATAWAAGTASWRQSRQFLDLGLGAPAAKEIRVFGLTGFVAANYRKHALGLWRRVWAERRSGLLAELVRDYLAIFVMAWLTFGYGGWLVQRGVLSVAAFVVLAQASVMALSLARFFGDADFPVEYGTVSIPALIAVEGASPTEDRRTADGAVARSWRCVRFEAVSFRYPDSDEDTLRELNLDIRAGESLAIVGLNGAGKSTLVKLLCGLYRPTRGRVTVDGRDIATLDPARWQRQIAVVFQDFVRWPLSARDNIGFGAPEQLGDMDRIHTAARLAGAEPFLTLLPAGLDTVLSPQFAGGSELSGGQWQRVALARALFAVESGADILVLDEPTSNLDARAETRLFASLLELAPAVSTVVISHRMSSVRRAERIIVIEHGTVVQDGSHSELLVAEGRYAELFRIQAERFSEPSSDGEEP